MADTDEAKTSACDHFEDSQDLMYIPKKSNMHQHGTARNLYSGFSQKDSRCEKPSQKSYTGGRSSKDFNHLTAVPTNGLLNDSDSESALSDSTSSLFQLECNTTQSATRHLVKSPANTLQADISVVSSLDPRSQSKLATSPEQPSPALNLKASFDCHERREYKTQAHQRGKRKKRYKSTGKPVGRPPLTATREEQERRLLDRGFQFPFVEREYGRKHPPMKMILAYEATALQGFFQYVSTLKCEEHLKKALEKMSASDDLENECLAMRNHKYVDDEGPISPIQETNDDDHNLDPDQEDLGAKIVDNSCFILSRKLPSKKKSKTKAKPAKLSRGNGDGEEEDSADVPGSV
ncbi:TATA box-binding protein-associated factor RNA polymerase I subunit D isoform X2 [Pelodiscus sinensis]|uniref:TATA box-binding protein-associated factor RNA polymerase I subunit D isoform X2 n=1 Tax=Pelodiscus sinensis TaxID=13735 RepID=UPI003F6D1343